MSGDPAHNPRLADSGLTIPSDSEVYHEDYGISPLSSSQGGNGIGGRGGSAGEGSGAQVVVCRPSTIWSFLRSTAINLLLPFVNGMMLGFGELLAHEAAFRLGWSGTKIFPVPRRTQSHPIGPGIEVRDADKRASELNDLLACN